jgi:hypothetical protein
VLQPSNPAAPAFVYGINGIYDIQDFAWSLLLLAACCFASPSFVIAHR